MLPEITSESQSIRTIESLYGKRRELSLIILIIYYVNICQVYLCLYLQGLLIFANEGCHNSLWLIDTVFDKSGNAIIHDGWPVYYLQPAAAAAAARGGGGRALNDDQIMLVYFYWEFMELLSCALKLTGSLVLCQFKIFTLFSVTW